MNATDPSLARASSRPDDPLLSVVIPVRNEAASIASLVAELGVALVGIAHEIIYVDDGSSDGTAEALAQASLATAPLRWFRHRTSCGQSAAIVTGIHAARGNWIATLDGDGQNDPADIIRLLDLARREEPLGPRPVLVAGHRTKRRDGMVKRLSSRVANAVRAWLLGDRTPDSGCGLKVFRREAFLSLPQFDHMHRFLPALFLRAGGRIIPVSVNHRPRVHGRSNYGTLDRLWVGLFDLVGVAWLMRRELRPEIESD